MCSFLWPREKPAKAQVATTLERKTNLAAFKQNSQIHIRRSYTVHPRDGHRTHRAFRLFRPESNEAPGKTRKIEYPVEHLQTAACNKHPRPRLTPGHSQNCPLTAVSQSPMGAESRVSQEDAGDTRPLAAQQKEVHKLIYKGM